MPSHQRLQPVSNYVCFVVITGSLTIEEEEPSTVYEGAGKAASTTRTSSTVCSASIFAGTNYLPVIHYLYTSIRRARVQPDKVT